MNFRDLPFINILINDDARVKKTYILYYGRLKSSFDLNLDLDHLQIDHKVSIMYSK